MKRIEDLGQILVVLHLLSDCPASERELRLSLEILEMLFQAVQFTK